jgi:hypothetical protein
MNVLQWHEWNIHPRDIRIALKDQPFHVHGS